VSILGQSIVNKSTANLSDLRKNHIGFVFQFYHLIPSLTVYENLLLRDVVSDKKGFTIEKALEAVGLTGESHKYPHMLSGGQQQRVSIARAILNQPDILFADEPTGNLDLQSSIEIMDLLKTLNRDYHITILLVTHNDQLLTYANRTITLLDGQVMQDENA
jgi:ABC-type lipoprotein export system ATPase subunit